MVNIDKIIVDNIKLNHIKLQNDNDDYLDYKKELVFDLEYNALPEPNYLYYENFICVTSEFPYGFGLDTGRAHLYYSEYVCNQLFSSIKNLIFRFRVTRTIFILIFFSI